MNKQTKKGSTVASSGLFCAMLSLALLSCVWKMQTAFFWSSTPKNAAGLVFPCRVGQRRFVAAGCLALPSRATWPYFVECRGRSKLHLALRIQLTHVGGAQSSHHDTGTFTHASSPQHVQKVSAGIICKLSQTHAQVQVPQQGVCGQHHGTA